jgi:hypothetical protein
MKRVKNTLVLILVGLTYPLIASTVFANEKCELDRSVYSDIEKKGFELIFRKKPNDKQPSPYASAIIKHSKLGTIWSFDVYQYQGYASIILKSNLPSEEQFDINFFDQSLESARPPLWKKNVLAPYYVFISGLGSRDYYRRRASNIFIFDTMWILKGCQ